jgi:hypothetical protein
MTSLVLYCSAVLVLYYSGFVQIARMAEAEAKGVRSAGHQGCRVAKIARRLTIDGAAQAEPWRASA